MQPQTPPNVAARAAPVPKAPKSRLHQDGRDMFWSLAPLVLACIVLAGLVGTCSLQTSGPTPGKTPTYDAATALKADAETLGFPIRLPKLPEGWQPNSGARNGLEAGLTDPATGQPARAKISTVGYITPNAMYVSLTQSNADEDKLVRWLDPGLYASGAQDVAGVKWVVYEGGERDEPVWTTRLTAPGGGTQIAITGAGGGDEFRTLATATQTQSPLPAR